MKTEGISFHDRLQRCEISSLSGFAPCQSSRQPAALYAFQQLPALPSVRFSPWVGITFWTVSCVAFWFRTFTCEAQVAAATSLSGSAGVVRSLNQAPFKRFLKNKERMDRPPACNPETKNIKQMSFR